MSTQQTPDTSPETRTATKTGFELTPPDPVPHIEPEQAVGLVPVTTEQKSKLDQ
ncbi:MAG: toxic anion resistance protein, partial [Erythrobacter sp.]|nr:toxic anion resistance protein [Erythrobacter sp.]